jgi:hypothetical protein
MAAFHRHGQHWQGIVMRVTGFWTLLGAVVVAVMIADFVHNPTGTTVLTNAATTSEKTALNAELGQTS